MPHFRPRWWTSLVATAFAVCAAAPGMPTARAQTADPFVAASVGTPSSLLSGRRRSHTAAMRVPITNEARPLPRKTGTVAMLLRRKSEPRTTPSASTTSSLSTVSRRV